MADLKPVPFWRRVREELAARGLRIGDLAESAELDPSLVSRLLSENESTRREPRTEHLFAIARALGVPPSDLAHCADVEPAIRDWVSRPEFESECDARSAAQAEMARARAEAAAAQIKIESLHAANQDLLSKLDRSEQQTLAFAANTRREVEQLRRERDAAIANFVALEDEYQSTVDQANTNYRAFRQARAQIARLQSEIVQSNAREDLAWVVAGLAGIASLATHPVERKRRPVRAAQRR